MGERIRSFDWAATPLGPPETWPQSLRSAVSIMLPSKAQIVLFWGPQLITLYNDACRPGFGAKHPRVLGLPAHQAWSEVWSDGLEGLFHGVLSTGEAYWASNRLFLLRRALLRFSRILGPMEEMASRLEHLEAPCIDAEVRPYFRDVADHVRRTASRVGGLREVLSQVFELSNLLEQQRQGVITRKLAAWAAMLAVPTAIAGIYGMNFATMPELHWIYGYPAALGGMALLCGVLYWRFKRSGWL